MDLQTQAMIAGAGVDKHVTAGMDKDTSLWHGMLMVNHPTPSGCDRYMMVLSDKRGWVDAETAKREFEKLLPEEVWPRSARGGTHRDT